MYGFAILLLSILPFLHAQFLQPNPDDTDSSLWSSATTTTTTTTAFDLDAGSSLFDDEDEELTLQKGIGLDDYIHIPPPFQPLSLVAGNDNSPAKAIFTAETSTDPSTTSLDECPLLYGSSFPSRRLRTREGAFCTSDDGTSDNGIQVNDNPSLAGLDASERVIDPENRRQCAYKFETLCCEGPVYGDEVADCVRCKLAS